MKRRQLGYAQIVQILIERVAPSPYKYTPCDLSSTYLFLLR
jgi:hypothetical protein